jgi:hypothetical protein
MPLIWLVSVTLGFGTQTSCPAAATLAARDRYARGDYTGAFGALADVEVCVDGSEVELAEAFRWRAQAKAAAGDNAGSIEAWALLWTVLPTYVLDPLESPKFHELYAAGRSRAAQGRLVFGRLVRTKGGRVIAQVFDPHRRVQRVHIKFDAMEMSATHHDDGTWSAMIPEGAFSASAVFESGDAALFRTMKVVLSELPSPVEELTAARRPPPSDTKKWVIIGGAAGAAVVIGVVITAVALGAKRYDGSLGRVELP